MKASEYHCDWQAKMKSISWRVEHRRVEAGISLLETVTLNSAEAGRNVKEIVILHGLPITHAAAVLAHEFGHVWCFLNKVPRISLPVQEGICEMFSFAYLSELDTPESLDFT